ncbi:hypothetical protein [uncultured Vagococcus sp.]|uniref:hypothetical protein n=1 Tax=uncultured Vagococcus sp. TaxID=189676 RepID=UPI0028D7D58D|nr:hypothetical protein [uncultured Vagococcus sp.]
MAKINRVIVMQTLNKWKYFWITSFLTGINYIKLLGVVKTKDMSVGDSLGFLFLGIRPISHLDPTQLFNIPFLWLSMCLYLFYSLAAMIRATSSTYDYLTFFYLRKRRTYWFFKVKHTLVIISIHFMVIIITSIICTILFGGRVSISPTMTFWTSFIPKGSVVSGFQFIFQTMIMPWLACATIGILELTLLYFGGELQSFIIISIYLIMSSFFTSPLLIGNYLMLLKSSIVEDKGIDNLSGILVMVVSMIVLNVVGIVKLRKWDYMN